MLSPYHWISVDASKVGIRIYSEQGTLQDRRRTVQSGPKIHGRRYSDRLYSSGLVQLARRYVGRKKFDKSRYPDLSKTVRYLHDSNVHFMVSIWPNMSPNSENYAEFAKKGMLLPNSNLYNAFDENARKVYWDQTTEEIMSAGTDALWCDNSEPFSDADWSGSSKKPEKERYLVVTETSKRSMDSDRLNSYGLYHSKGIYENWRKTYPGKRVVNLTRSGYTGIQSLGAILWSGDITATYDTLRKQIVEGIRMSLTGMPYWTLDIGGFFTVNDKYENRGCNDTEHKPLWFWRGDYNDGVNDMGYRSSTPDGLNSEHFFRSSDLTERIPQESRGNSGKRAICSMMRSRIISGSDTV